MIISRKIIEKYLPEFQQIKNDDFITACNNFGIEVEKILTNPLIKNLIVGKITDVQPHPNSSKLSVCLTKISSTKTLQIVCGAVNVAIGKKVVVALKDAVLPNGKLINDKIVSEIKSEGMLCSYSELILNRNFASKEDENEIIILNDDAVVGDNKLSKYINFNDDIYDLSIPANRNDLNCVFSVCHELAGHFKWETPLIPKINNFEKKITSKNLLYENNCCNGACYISIDNIKIAPSPIQLRSILINNGIKPINNIVDTLNYITTLTNVPLHAYDADHISNEISIQSLKDDITFLALNNESLDLKTNDIVIKSNNTVVALAGVIGGADSKITNTTNKIVIEIANFNPTFISHTTKRLKIATDAAKRFSKPISLWSTAQAIDLIFKYFNNYKITNVNAKFEKQHLSNIKIDWECMERFLGTNISKQEVITGLKWYGFSYDNGCFTPPPYRLDVSNQEDVFEEILKVISINNLLPTAVIGPVYQKTKNTESNLINELKTMMIYNNFSEVKTYNLTSLNRWEEFNIFNLKETIKIKNPNVSTREVLRNNLTSSLLKVYQYNSSYKNNLNPIFEIQKIYQPSITFNNISLLAFKEHIYNHINNSKIIYDVLTLKSIALEIAGLFNTQFEFHYLDENTFLYANESVSIYCKGELIGYIGYIKKEILKNYDLQTRDLYLLTLNFDNLIKNYQAKKIVYSPYENTQTIYKDISFILKKDKKIAPIIQLLETSKLLLSCDLIDQFSMKDEQTSYTLRCELENTKILTSKDIETITQKIQLLLTQKSAIIRK